MKKVGQGIEQTGRFVIGAIVGGNLAISPMLICQLTPPALGQIIPDNTLPSPSDTQAGCTVCTIEGGTQQGNNLFHSFTEFSVPTGGEAIFNNPDPVETIFSRVTGDSISDIDGFIRANGTADFFLLNPNGIIFGPNAQLDIGGSFIASTANAIRFGDQAVFSASEPQSSSLLSIDPTAFFFTSASNGAIDSQSIAPAGFDPFGAALSGLRVPDGESLLLLGRDISLIGGRLNALEGQIDLVSISGAGNVDLISNNERLNLNVPDSISPANISLEEGAILNTYGFRSGAVKMWGQSIQMQDGSLIQALNFGPTPGENVIITASESFRLTGTTPSGLFGSGVFSQTFGSGNSGNLVIVAPDVIIQDGGQISTATFGEGSGGELLIEASDSVQIVGESLGGFGSGLLSIADSSTGTAGSISITTGELLVQAGGFISSAGFDGGTGGPLNINASESVQLSGTGSDTRFSSGLFSSTQGSGAAGDLSIVTPSLLINNGAQAGSGSFGPGNAGRLTVTASKSIQLTGTSTDELRRSGLFSRTEGAGNAGDLEINTPMFLVQNGAQVQAGSAGSLASGAGGKLTINVDNLLQLSGSSPITQQGSRILTQADGSGPAGDLEINTSHLIMQDGSQISSATLNEGTGGRLTINASDLIQVTGTSGQFGTVLSSQTNGSGDAGNTQISTKRLIVERGGQISSATLGAGRGGNLTVEATESILLTGVVLDGLGASSGLFTEAQATGDAGNTKIVTPNLSVQDGASISASTVDGMGGTVLILADTLTVNGGAQIRTTTSGAEDAGDITLDITDSISLTGAQSGLFANTERGAGGDGGNISINSLINPKIITVSDGASIAVDSRGSGVGGIIELETDLLTLADNASISAETFSNRGGSIFLQLQDALLLRRGSLISTNAGIEQGLGDGGNINIAAELGFVVAVSEENSDITANAFQGRGGNVNINAQSTLGIEARPKLTPLSDITASSEFGLSGTVEINNLGVDPAQGLVMLPDGLLNASQLIIQGCDLTTVGSQGAFYTSGRGGVALLEILNPQDIVDDLRLPETWSDNGPITEAQGWFMSATGDAVLTTSPVAIQERCGQNE